MRYWKKVTVAALSIICFLLSMAAAVLGEPVPSTGQLQVETQPNTDSGNMAQVPPAPITLEITLPPAQTPEFADASSSAVIASSDQQGTGLILPANKTPENTEVKSAPEQKPVAVEPKPAAKPVAKAPDAEQKDALAKVTPAKPKVQAAKKPVPKVTPKSDVEELKKTQPGFIARIISATKGLIGRAISWLGTRYIWGGLSAKGVDCSGLTKLLYKSEGINLPRTAREQFKAGLAVARTALLPGDLVFFNTSGPISHVGMYIGNGKFVHAANPKRGVRVDSLGSSYYNKRFAGARRYKEFG